jgi:hypothetical protein
MRIGSPRKIWNSLPAPPPDWPSGQVRGRHAGREIDRRQIREAPAVRGSARHDAVMIVRQIEARDTGRSGRQWAGGYAYPLSILVFFSQ